MELREVEKFRPIPRGGLKLLVFPLLILSVMATIWVSTLFVIGKDAWANKGFVALLTLISAASIVGMPLFISRYPLRWSGDYLRRNVRGHNAWFWRDEGEIRVVVTRRGKGEGKDLKFPSSCPIIKIPLGGWFNSSGGVYWCHFDGKVGRVQGWTVKRPSWIRDDVHFPRATLIDSEGQSITIYVGTALDFFKYRTNSVDWSWVVDGMLEDIKRLGQERDEVKKRAETLEGELSTVRDRLDCALRAMDEAIVGIKNTSRLGKSKEAKRIREGLIEDLLQIAPSGHPRRLVYELASSQAAAEAQAGG